MNSDGTAEEWVEVNVVPEVVGDERMLIDVIEPLVHEELRNRIETWFFFWEPELRLRIRWRSAEGVGDEGRRLLTARLDACKNSGEIVEWYEGAHGDRGARYEGEADYYGHEMWEVVQKDWMNGSEFALTLIALDFAGHLSKSRQFHWSRHVHLFSNQTGHSYEEEAQLCLQQASGYLLQLQQHGHPKGSEMLKTARSIDMFLALYRA